MADNTVRGIMDDGDRPLTEKEKRGIKEGWYRPANGLRSFADKDPETLREFQKRGQETMRARREAKKLAELAAYMEAHKELAHVLLGTKMAMIAGLLDEMRIVDDHGNEAYDTRLLDDKRLKTLLSIVDQVERRGFGNTVSKQEQQVNVDVTHRLAELAKQLEKGE